MKPLPTRCPFTGGPIVVTQFHSPEGDITVNGRFQVHAPLASLTPEQLVFVLTFIQCEGKFNRMQEELNLSYPTLRSRLKEIIQALGLKEPPVSAEDEPDMPDRMGILEQIHSGALSVEEALDTLRAR